MKMKIEAKLDPKFQPLELVFRDFEKRADEEGSVELILSVEGAAGLVNTVKTRVFAVGHEDENIGYAERLVKSMLWVYGGYKVIVAGPKYIFDAIDAAYKADGARAFDFDFMANVFEHDFECEYRNASDMPETKGSASSVGRHLDGCRIGFDAGGSDRKVSAVIDGETVYSEEVVWFPKTSKDPQYQYDGILSALKTAASHMPRVDAIGVSSAGVCINNRLMSSSIFLACSKEDFDRVGKNVYIDTAREIGDVPVELANDGDVTALAGAMDLDDNNVLGIAMGTSEAGGYVDGNGNITGWLNELAFVPCDYSKEAMVDEWSGDYGCGVKYFSQDAVIKLAPAAGIELDPELSPAEKLKVVQKLMSEGDRRAIDIYETIGVYFGYTIAYYSRFYDIKHVLIMGRVTSGDGGQLVLDNAQKVLDVEFPDIAAKTKLHIPDEKSRRVGQSVAAASLPALRK